MFIRIEKGSAIPISRQVAEQIRAQCLCGSLRPGERLPAVRELAKELAVNINTILRVYERLEAEELIEMRHGDGTFVRALPGAIESGSQLKIQREKYGTELDALVRRGLLLGLSAQDLRRRLDSSLKAAVRWFEGSARTSSKTQHSTASENKP
jgi:GntR family transcriptional regulator